MSNPIDRVGKFRGPILSFGVGETSKSDEKRGGGGYPQFIASLKADEMYDDETKDWIPWAEYDQVATGFFVLTSVDDKGIPFKCPNYDDVMNAVGWDGITYSSLAAMDLSETKVQFTIEESEFKGTTQLKPTWIKPYDAPIGIRTLDKAELSALDKKFAVNMPKAKPISAPKKAPPKKPAPPKPEPKAEPEAAPIEPMTEEEAYQKCVDFNAKLNKPAPDSVLDDYWVSRIQEIAKNENNPTPEEYGKICTAVLEDLDIPF